jgi:SNF2 family DNA or RNA helicase
MQSPELTYREDRLELRFPGWTKKQVDAVREDFLCWKRLRGKGSRDDLLTSEPIALAMWEARDLFPKLVVSDEDRAKMRVLLESKVSPSDSGVEFLNDLYPVQVKATLQLLNREKAILTAAPGLGKTVIALTALANASPELVVIVAPLTSFDGWVEEIQKWLLDRLDLSPQDFLFYKWRDIKSVQPLIEGPTPLTVVLTTPNVLYGMDDRFQSSFGQGIASVFYDASSISSFLVLDESFLYQERKAGRTERITSLAYNFRSVWLLSGMPVSRFNDDLYAQLHLLMPQVFSSYWKFAARYCLLENSHWGTKIVGDKLGSTERLQRDLMDILIQCDYPEDIPDWIPTIVSCPMLPRQEEIYRKAVEELQVDAQTLGSNKPLTLKSLLTLTVRLLQISSNPVLLEGHDESGKWDKLLSSLTTENFPALVWVKFKTTAKLISERIAQKGLRVAVLTGATKPAERYQRVKDFQSGKLDVLVLNDAVGKYSLTLTAAHAVFYLERDFNGEAYYQSLYRARRITSEHPIKIFYLLSTYASGRTAIDQVVHDTLLSRSRKAQLLTVGQLLGSI